MPKTKSILTSKTFWFNFASLVLIAAQALQGAPWFSPEIQAGIIAVGNAVLRMLTGQPVTFTGKPLAVALILPLALSLAACAGVQPGGGSGLDAKQALKQLPGIVSSLAILAQAAPVDEATKAQITKYADLAAVAAQGAAELGKVEKPADLAGAFDTVAALAEKLPVDSGTASQIGGYVAWGKFALKALGAISGQTSDSGGIRNKRPFGCASGCHSEAGSQPTRANG
ncbi:MAG: hypothetical protein FD177_1009 [Desulfovibrionaceae bacterium]|nr:MAG: hypothetical protein FD177_1009 [Desulfovibrionaceae bacterium]